ncbi:HNH endonuclease family protein [Streptomyces sp. NPDC090023]|uniref:HNH endonuclease family protein n=1 Tax=unclassified Streptomyces TaxID=2593676 RepID=UPI00381E2742
MLSKFMALAAATLVSLPVSASPAAAHAPIAATTLPLTVAVERLAAAAESGDGYQRDLFKHWVDADQDGCDTRAEVLISESRNESTVHTGCRVTAGTWFSYYDGVTVTDPAALDIDHVVPLAEAWDSGASTWTAERREAYANDLDGDSSLVAVTARTNRSKGDSDPSEWLPPLADARCTYAADWVATKLRWHLAADPAEHAALTELAAGCGQQHVTYEPTSLT